MICHSCGRDVPGAVTLDTHRTTERPDEHDAPCGRRCIGGGLTARDKYPGELTMAGAIVRAHRRSGCEVCGRADSRRRVPCGCCPSRRFVGGGCVDGLDANAGENCPHFETRRTT